jgi:thiamine pyrophosphate-dependent acetolactate synthase large subunit-like protein
MRKQANPAATCPSPSPAPGPRLGSQILVECLEREGVDAIFAYPGGASMEIHQALTRSSKIRVYLPRHEQGGVFAAEGYAHATGRVGVCMDTSGPGATNLVTGIADAYMDSVPVVAITGQVPQAMTAPRGHISTIYNWHGGTAAVDPANVECRDVTRMAVTLRACRERIIVRTAGSRNFGPHHRT